MKFRCRNADAVWMTYRDGSTMLHERSAKAGDILIPVNLPKIKYGKPNRGQNVTHVALTFLVWDDYRYKIDGGLVLAIGIPGTQNLGPGSLQTDKLFDRNIDFGTTVFQSRILYKESEATQWHDGVTKEGKVRLTVDYAHDWIYCVWDASETYKDISHAIIKNINDRVNGGMFQRNRLHWGDDPTKDERGFVRQSEIRVSFPSFATPGVCIEECLTNKISVGTWNQFMDMACTMINLDTDAFQKNLEGKSPTHIMRANDTIVLNVLEAIVSAVLCVSGLHVGYDNEYIDDTSVPWQKKGTNSDCEDFAIAAVGLFTFIQTEECTFSNTANTFVGRWIVSWIKHAYTEAVVATGFVTPSAARPDLPPEEVYRGLGGHGFMLVRKCNSLQPDYKLRWMLVECTALTISYRPLSVPSFGRSSSSVCEEVFGNYICLYSPSTNVQKIQTSIGHASLLGLDRRGVPYKYKTVSTVSNGHRGDVVTLKDGVTVGVDIEDFLRCEIVKFIPSSEEKYMDMYNRYFRGFLMNPPTVEQCFVDAPVPPQRRAPPLKNLVGPKEKMFGVVAVSGNDLWRRPQDESFIALPKRIIPTVLGDVVLCGSLRSVGMDYQESNLKHVDRIRTSKKSANRHKAYFRHGSGPELAIATHI